MVAGQHNPSARSTSLPGRGFRVIIADSVAARRRQIAQTIEDLVPTILQVEHTNEALDCLSNDPVDLVIASMEIKGSGAIELCKRLKFRPDTERIPFLILGSVNDLEHEASAFQAGADGFLMGQFRPEAFRARVQACLRQKAMIDCLDETETVLFTLAQSVEGRDPALGLHCERLALIAVAMGVQLGLPGRDILALQRGGYLHDVGKVAIPDSVLLKPGPLTPEEWVIMKTHPEKGEKICSSLRSLSPVLPIIRHHHEKWDGTGYPDGLSGEQIPLLARILQFADIYDALTADRPYKKAFTSTQAIDIMRSEAAKGWRDPELMRVFETVVPLFASHDTTAESLQALADALARCRKQPASVMSVNPQEFVPAKLVSGL